MKTPDRDPKARPTETTPPKSAEKPQPVRLDLERLDLSVEEVEERIRPGETNVFDK
jgi:hypothetical protein